MVVQLVGISVSRSSPIAVIRTGPDSRPVSMMEVRKRELATRTASRSFHVEPNREGEPLDQDRTSLYHIPRGTSPSYGMGLRWVGTVARNGSSLRDRWVRASD